MTFFIAETSHGDEAPIDTGEVKAVEQSDSYRVQDVIGQLLEPAFEK